VVSKVSCTLRTLDYHIRPGGKLSTRSLVKLLCEAKFVVGAWWDCLCWSVRQALTMHKTITVWTGCTPPLSGTSQDHSPGHDYRQRNTTDVCSPLTVNISEAENGQQANFSTVFSAIHKHI